MPVIETRGHDQDLQGVQGPQALDLECDVRLDLRFLGPNVRGKTTTLSCAGPGAATAQPAGCLAWTWTKKRPDFPPQSRLPVPGPRFYE